jgi:hypothetical protein
MERRALKVRNRFYGQVVISLFQSLVPILFYPGATRFASLSACPWLLHFGAFSA